MTRKASAARNNAAYGQGNGKTVVPYSPSLSLETLDTGILLLAVFTLDLEMDHPSETSLCTVAPAPDNKTYQWMDWICSLLTVYILL